jgi:hypothetical protein
MSIKEGLFRQGKNDKWFLVKKSSFTVNMVDILTADGSHIKQSALQLFLFANAMKKTRERVRELIMEAIGKGLPCEGALQATITNSKPVKVLDKDMLSVVLEKHGYTLEQFYREGKAPEKLIVE